MDELPIQQPVVAKPKGNFFKVIIFLSILLGFFSTYVAGYYTHVLFSREEQSNTFVTKPTPKQPQSPRIQNDSNAPVETKAFIPGKAYFENSVLFIAKNDPRFTVIATVTRQENNSGYTQGSRVSYFNGDSWSRHVETKSNPDVKVTPGSLITSWNEVIDTSRVLKETLNGSVAPDGHDIRFSTKTLSNEITMRSLPGYTKLMSNGEGTLTVDGQEYQSYVLYTQIYSMNSGDIQFYNQPFGVTTDWIALWKNDGTFYHIDTTAVDNPTDIYKSHKIGVFEEQPGEVAKTFDVTVQRDSSLPPSSYAINLGDPVNRTLHLSLLNSINKAPNGPYKWYLSQIKDDQGGIGIAEYIHN